MFILGAPKVQIIRDGAFLEGGKIYVYESGTTTPRPSYPTWTDALNETNPNDHPVILDERGEADIVLKGSSTVTVKDAADNLLWSVDDLDNSDLDIVSLNGGTILTFTGVENAINHFSMSNGALGDEIVLEAVGEDTDIDLTIVCKGTGKFIIKNGDLDILGDLNLTSGDVLISSGDVTANGTINLGSGNLNIQAGGFSLFPAGTMIWYGGTTAPDGWLECDGSAISRTSYTNLFNKIGTIYGPGNGTTTFNLPNQARRTLVGKGGSSTGTLGNTIGSTGGTETHTLTTAEMPAHTHSYRRDGSAGSNEFGPVTSVTFRDTASYSTVNTGSTGGGSAHNILQPSLVSMLMIRVF